MGAYNQLISSSQQSETLGNTVVRAELIEVTSFLMASMWPGPSRTSGSSSPSERVYARAFTLSSACAVEVTWRASRATVCGRSRP